MCVVADDCANLSPSRPFADPETMTCRPPCGDTPIPGCAVCARPGVCEKCAEGLFGFGWLELADGGQRCINHAQRAWLLVYATFGFAAVALLVYSALLARRPAVNKEVLRDALKHREKKAHNGGPNGFWGRIDDGLAGRGVPLYFRVLLLLCAASLCAAAVCKLANPERWTQGEATGLDCDYTLVSSEGHGQSPPDDSPRWVDEMVDEAKTLSRQLAPSATGAVPDVLPKQMEHAPHRAVLFGFLYLFLTVGAVVAFAAQRRRRDALHQDFALRLSNLPPTLTDPAELRAYIESLQLPCVGVSICYDYQAQVGTVDAALDSAVGGVDCEASGAIRATRAVQTDEALDLTPALRGSNETHAALFDYALMPLIGLKESGEKPIHGSGYAFAVFPTVADAKRAETRINARGVAPLVAGGVPRRVRAERAACEPLEVLWENYTSFTHFLPKIVVGIFFTIATSILWMLLSVPYALYFVGRVLTPTLGSSHTAQEVLLGMLISFGNILVSRVVGQVTDWSGFHAKRTRDVAVLVLAFIATLFNTLFDMAIIVVVAYHATLTAAFEGSEEGYPRVLAQQLYELIVPGYLFIPVFVVPVLERVLPYYLGVWYVRSKPRVLLRDAKEGLAHGPFDICWRYADILNNFTICTALLFLPSGNSWRVMIAFSAFCACVFVVDRYILLFCSSITPYATATLYKAFWSLFCIPSSLFAVLVAFWAVHAKFLPSWWWVCGAFFGHIFIFLVLLTFLSGEPAVHDETYAQVLQRLPGSYFSQNPVCQLRMRVLGEMHGDDGSRVFAAPKG